MLRCLASLFFVVFAETALSAAEVPAKLPIPTDAAQAETLQLVKELYADQYASAKTSPQKTAIARDLIGKAKETQNDPIGRYVLLKVAKDIAALAADGETTFQAIDVMGESFTIDALGYKADALTAISKHAKVKEDHKAITEMALRLADEAIAADRFERATELARFSVSEGRAANDAELSERVRDKFAEIQAVFDAYAEVKKATFTLQQTPNDPTANLTAGRYFCLIKGDWQKGLPLLALGSDAALKAAAAQELKPVTSAAEQARLGDLWYDIAGAQQELSGKGAYARSAFWYDKALPALTGLAKDKADKRLRDIRLAQSSSGRVYLDDLAEFDVHVGFAVLGKHGKSGTGHSHPFNGSLLEHSLAAAPPANGASSVSYQLKGQYKVFEATAGIPDDRTEPGTPLTFRVLGDGKTLWQSRPLKVQGESQECRVNVRNVKVLTLQVLCPGHANFAWPLWIDPQLVK